MRTIRKAAEALPNLFGFTVLALVIAAGSCRFNRAKAQEEEDPYARGPKTYWCNQAYLESVYGSDWHIWWALEMCWLYTEPAPTHVTAAPSTPRLPRQFFIGGRR